jgi:hypothetical protein
MRSRIRFFCSAGAFSSASVPAHIPQQTAIGRSVNIRLDYGGTFLLAPRPARAVTPARWACRSRASAPVPSHPAFSRLLCGRTHDMSDAHALLVPACSGGCTFDVDTPIWAFRYPGLALPLGFYSPRISSGSVRSDPGWTGEPRWSYPSRYDESTSMAEDPRDCRKLGIHRRMDRERVLSAVRLNVRDRYVRSRSSSRRGRFWKRIGGHHGNNGTPPIAFGAGSERNYQRWKWPNAPFVRYVRKRKMARRLVGQELFVPQSYRSGEEDQGGQQRLGRLRRPARVARRRSVRGIPGSRAGASERRGRPQYSIKR